MNTEFEITDNKFKLKNSKLIVIVCFISSVIITIVHNLNINSYIKYFIIPMFVLLCAYIFIIEKIKIKKNNKAYIMLVPILLILFSKIIVDIDYINMILNIIILPILLISFFLMLANSNYRISRFFMSWFLKIFLHNMFDNLRHTNLKFNFKDDEKKKKISDIIKGCLVGSFIATILLVLLANGDKYFGVFISKITDGLFNIFNFKVLTRNIMLLFISFMILFSVIVNIIKYKNIKMREITYKEVNNSMVSTILIIVNMVFVLFLISEISKVTINFLHIPKEYTYAEYAREGFFQLLFVTIINFSIILYFIYFTRIVKENKFIRRLILLLILFSITLIFNSYYRMFLYIYEYGFTILRMQVILFLAMEFILFIVIIKKIIKKLKHKDAYLFTGIIIITYIINLYLCNNTLINFINNCLGIVS